MAKAEARLRGRHLELNRRQEAHLVALHGAGEHSTAELGDLFGVGRSTVYRVIARDGRQRKHPSARRPGTAMRYDEARVEVVGIEDVRARLADGVTVAYTDPNLGVLLRLQQPLMLRVPAGSVRPGGTFNASRKARRS